MTGVVVRLDRIRTDGGTQSRDMNSPGVIDDYAEAMRAGATFPPVTVFFDGSDYWLADGFHRVLAARSVGLDGIDTDVRQGTRRDAVLYACGANSVHGLRRTNADKRRAVMTLLDDAEWSQWSDNEIARRVGVSQPFVGSMRPAPTYNGYKSEPQTRRGADGRTTDTSNIGGAGARSVASSPPQKSAPAPASYRCETCGERFDEPVWECADCGNHWPDDESDCRNCAVQEPLPVPVTPSVQGFLAAIRNYLTDDERVALVHELAEL